MIYSYKELIEKKKYNSGNQIASALKKGKLFKITDRIYTNKIEEFYNPDYIIVTSKKHPKGIITMDTAFYLYGLIDTKPNKVSLMTRRNIRIKDSFIYQVFSIDKTFEIGKTKLKVNGYTINIYDKERLLIELIRKKKYYSSEYYQKMIKVYKKIFHELDIKKLESYIERFSVRDYLFEVIHKEFFQKV